MSVYSLHFSNQLGTLKHLKCPDHVVSRQSTIPGGREGEAAPAMALKIRFYPQRVQGGAGLPLDALKLPSRQAGGQGRAGWGRSWQGRAGQQTRPEAAAG